MAKDSIQKLGLSTTADWVANSSSAYATQLTGRINFPSAGKWLVFGVCPVCNTNSGIMYPSVSVGVHTRSNLYFNIGTYFDFLFVADVDASNEGVVMAAASSTAVTFSYIERGYITAVKIG